MSKKDKLDNGYRLDDFGLLFSDEKNKTREKSILLRAKNAESSVDSANQNNSSLRINFCHSERSEESKNNPFVILSDSEISQNNRDSSVASLSQNDKVEMDKNNKNFLDSTKSAESSTPPKKPQSKETKEQDFIYAPQFQGFDEILEESKDFGAQDFKAQNFDTQDFNSQDFSMQKQGAESSAKTQLTPQSEKDLLLRHPHTQNDTNALFIAYSILFLMLLAFMPQIYLANNIYTSSKNINLLKAQKDALRDENSDLQKQLESVKFNFLTLEIEEIK